MQVISKSELLQTLKEIQCQMYRSRIDGVGAVSWFSDIVNEQPVIDAAPVVHGRWIEIPVDYLGRNLKVVKQICSVCEQESACQHSYCPNCGAKMDLEDR